MDACEIQQPCEVLEFRGVTRMTEFLSLPPGIHGMQWTSEEQGTLSLIGPRLPTTQRLLRYQVGIRRAWQKNSSFLIGYFKRLLYIIGRMACLILVNNPCQTGRTNETYA